MSIKFVEGHSLPSPVFQTTATTAYETAFYPDLTQAGRYPLTIGYFVKGNRSVYGATANTTTLRVRGGVWNPGNSPSTTAETEFKDVNERPVFIAREVGNGPNRQALLQTDASLMEDKWYFIAASYFSASYRRVTVHDPIDGSLIGQTLDTANSSTLGITNGVLGIGAQFFGTLGMETTVAEMCTWREFMDLADLAAFSQVGFAATNRPTNLMQDLNFIYNWQSTGDPLVVEDNGPYSMDATLPSTTDIEYTPESPVPVFITDLSNIEFNEVTYLMFSVQAGSAYAALYPSGTARPSNADIVAGTGALASGAVALDGVDPLNLTLTLPNTGTTYVVYFAQDIGDGGSSYNEELSTFTSPTKYSEIITNIEGNETLNLSNIKYKWYDSTDLSALGSSTADGTTEVTDGTGLLEITLPNGVTTTAKGSQGTMMLQVDDGGTIKTAYHIVTVK